MKKATDYSKRLAQNIARSVNGVEIPTDDRSKISGALFDIVHEHHISVIHLTEKRHYGSALVLLRSIFESYVRGVWFMKCATNKDITRFMSDKFKSGHFVDRINEIKEIDEQAHGGLLAVKDTAWEGLNSYTHGGFRPVGRRFLGNNIQPNYSKEEIQEILRVANSFAILAFVQIAELSNNNKLMEKFEHLVLEFKSKYS